MTDIYIYIVESLLYMSFFVLFGFRSLQSDVDLSLCESYTKKKARAFYFLFIIIIMILTFLSNMDSCFRCCPFQHFAVLCSFFLGLKSW